MKIEPQILNDLKKVLSAFPKVLVVYVYGSRISGSFSTHSDLDMVLIVNDNLDIDYREIYLKLSKLFPDFELDLRIVSGENDPLFLFQILKNGKCVYTKNEKDRITFETKAMREFYDSERVRRIYDYYLKKSLKEGTFGHG